MLLQAMSLRRLLEVLCERACSFAKSSNKSPIEVDKAYEHLEIVGLQSTLSSKTVPFETLVGCFPRRLIVVHCPRGLQTLGEAAVRVESPALREAAVCVNQPALKGCCPRGVVPRRAGAGGALDSMLERTDVEKV